MLHLGGYSELSRLPPTLIAVSRNDRQQQMRRMSCIVIDAMHHRTAGADVIGNIFDIGGAENAGRQIEAGDFDTDAMAPAEEGSHEENSERILCDIAGRHV